MGILMSKISRNLVKLKKYKSTILKYVSSELRLYHKVCSPPCVPERLEIIFEIRDYNLELDRGSIRSSPRDGL